MGDTLRVGEHGKTIAVETDQDLSSYALGDLSLAVQLPDGTTVSWAATGTRTGNAPSSIIEYVLTDTDLPIRGSYIVHSMLDSSSPDVLELGDPPTVLRVLERFETTR